MSWKSDCAAVIPCLNEAASIGAVVEGVRRWLPAVRVIDDGSSDQTGPIARTAGAEVIRHSRPQGKGAALQTGWRQLLEEGFLWALSLDGDGQHAPQDIPRFLECADTEQARLVVGNRLAQADRMPWMRRQVNRWMSRRLSRLAGEDWPDTQCGFRLMHLPTWSRLALETCHFEIESEILLCFAAANQAIRFVPIEVIYRQERSKVNPWRDTARWFWWLWTRKRT